MSESSLKLPLWVVSGVVSLLASIGLTIIVMLLMGYKQGDTIYDIQAEALAYMGKDGKAPVMDTSKAMSGQQNVVKSRTVRPSTHIVYLVEKIDALTAEPGKLILKGNQAVKLVAILGKLQEPDYLGDAIAQENMDEMLEALVDHRKTLESSGFLWPSSDPVPPSAPPPNPFKKGEAAKHLSSLKERLQKAS